MSSRRFPGKVLAPFRGEPLIAHVLRAATAAVGERSVVVTTSTEGADDPLAAYLESLGIATFRGPLDDVFERFRLTLAAHPAEHVLRICADSPLLDPAVLRRVVDAGASTHADVVTTTQPRTFPKGTNAELIRVDALLAVDPSELDDDDREHVTRFFYRQPDRYRIVGVESGDPSLAALDYSIDTIDDLQRLERQG
jgi:spore coat polysaccharide biosynthesis protein SpsF